jgi:hypothetical protein
MTSLIRQYQGVPYIRIDTLPDEERESFQRWIRRQTRSVIPDEFDGSGVPAPCAYASDFFRWLAEGRPSLLAATYDT